MAELQSFMNQQVSIVTNDGRIIMGLLKGADQTTTLVLNKAVERVFSTTEGAEEVPLGLYIIRGANVALIGEIDQELDDNVDWEQVKAAPLKQIRFRKFKNGSKLTVVDFTASWCGPCKAVAPRFEQLADRYPNVNFLKVDVDEQRGIASEHEVRAMPTFQFFISGKKVDEVVGADIVKVERLVGSLAKSGSSFPATGGRTLGSGAPATSAATGGIPNLSNLTPMQQQYLIFGGMIIFFAVMYFNKS
ncbi:hypothetical protein HDU67_003262 [Dinochytrium kinnereticum]|nr:hypothetical protein HDU67_003262 [Dinochytrium kinnereticum]